jgi:hypothetical protein
MPQYLSSQDYQDYGTDLVSFTQRAALDSVAPHLRALDQQNHELRQRLAAESRHRMDQQVEAAIPNWRDLDQHPDWHQWLLGIDNLSGRVRQQLLNEAKASGDAARCIAFFRSFFNRARSQPHTSGGGGSSYGAQHTASSVSGPIYSAEQIKRLYRQHQQGAYRGREAEWARQEADIFRAQREGRVTGGKDVQGK